MRTGNERMLLGSDISAWMHRMCRISGWVMGGVEVASMLMGLRCGSASLSFAWLRMSGGLERDERGR